MIDGDAGMKDEADFRETVKWRKLRSSFGNNKHLNLTLQIHATRSRSIAQVLPITIKSSIAPWASSPTE